MRNEEVGTGIVRPLGLWELAVPTRSAKFIERDFPGGSLYVTAQQHISTNGSC